MPHLRSKTRRLLCTFGALSMLAACATPDHAPVAAADPRADGPWSFAVSGDSRNCGDVVMPSIAAGVRADRAAFYWHLGDLRWISRIDQDFQDEHPQAGIDDYRAGAWPDFEQNQIAPFGPIPFFLGIGNHETVPPKSRAEFIATFAARLDSPRLRAQRLADDPADRSPHAYYHWRIAGVEFINLDNASVDQFDAAQLAWLDAVLTRDAADGAVRAIVVGMHETLPESLSRGHSMSDADHMEISGIHAYRSLLEARKVKPVYVLASHSHFVMNNVFDTDYWRENGGVLPGWIVGTAGALRYPLPDGSGRASLKRTHVYGYLLATVAPKGERDADPIRFDFQEVAQTSVPADVTRRFSRAVLQACYLDNGP